MTENTQNHSSFENSLLYIALKAVLDEVRSLENQWYTGEHFHNDPREHPGERLIHYIRTGRTSIVMQKIKNNHPELCKTDFNLKSNRFKIEKKKIDRWHNRLYK